MIKSIINLKDVVEVECVHPDDSSQYYTFGVDHDFWIFDDDAMVVYKKELRKSIEAMVNPRHYWHEVKITIVVYFEGKRYEEEV